MKKLGFLTLAATALFMTGCSDDFGRPGGDGDGTVTFAVALPGPVTRAFSEGDKANQLYCLVYSNGKFVTATDEIEIKSKTATVQLELAKGVEYDIVFWASNTTSTTVIDPVTETSVTAYTIDKTTGDLKIDYDKIKSNDDTADAFYATKHFRGGEPNPTETISLTRPFAQINIGATDLDEDVVQKAYNNGVYANLTYQAYTTMNLVRKETDLNTKTTVTTKVASCPDSENNPYPIDPLKTKYTNMAYALVDQETTCLMEVGFGFYTSETSTTPVESRSFDNVPLQTNYRTNIYGALLTSDTDFNITVDPAFTLPSNDNPPSIAENTAKFKEMLADKSFEGKTTDVVLTNGLTENVTINADVPTTLNLDFNNMPVTSKITAGPNVILNIKNVGINADAPATPEAARRRNARRVPDLKEVSSELFVAENGATISIYDGYYKTNGHVVARANGGTINIYGGYFWARETRNEINKKVVLNNGGHINVYGGYFRSQNVDNGSLPLSDMGIYPDPACKVSKHSDAESPYSEVWLQVEKVWHPGVNLASLEWENVGTGYFRDPWIRNVFEEYNSDSRYPFSDYENFADLPVTIQRCKTYPTLYKLVNPYADAARVWFNNTGGCRLLDWLNGEIIFDMHNTACVTVVPGIACGISYYYDRGDNIRPFNLEGAVYYNLRNRSELKDISLERIVNSDVICYGEYNEFTFGKDLTRYDKGTRTLHFRNALIDLTECGEYNMEAVWPMGVNESNWQQKQRGHLIFPENFVLLDVYGNPVK